MDTSATSLKDEEELDFLWNSTSSDDTQHKASINSFFNFSGFGERFSSNRTLSHVLPETTQTAECNVSSIGSEVLNDHVDGDASMVELAPEGALAFIVISHVDADASMTSNEFNRVIGDVLWLQKVTQLLISSVEGI